MSEASHLPRLLYYGDVAVAHCVAGEAQLYRLLAPYPVEKLLIVESGLCAGRTPEQSLPGIVYRSSHPANQRVLHSRFARLARAWRALTSSATGSLRDLARQFQPEAILSVAHGTGWLTAAALARQTGLPLHLIVHDDPADTWKCAAPFQKWFDQQSTAALRQARSRLCVSPFMASAIENRLGLSCEILYPARAPNSVAFSTPAEHLAKPITHLTVGYAGSINSLTYAELLAKTADALACQGGRLILYSSLSLHDAERLRLRRPEVDLRPRVPSSAQLIETLRNDADVLLVPMSFAAHERSNMEVSFPSKLTDYTATGLPLLVWGPDYCSAVRWARSQAGFAEMVDRESTDDLAAALQRLRDDADLRLRLARRAIEVGSQHFSAVAAQATFAAALSEPKAR